MIALLSNIIFTAPWLLLGLLSLPVLWILLRITPPAPKIIRLPTARFLKGLVPETRTASKTPLWLLLLRMLILALVILALSGPVYNPSQAVQSDDPLRLVIDNGWSSASNWNTQIRAVEEGLAVARRAGRSVMIVTTAPQAGEDNPLITGMMSAGDAMQIAGALKPLPWEVDYKQTLRTLKEKNLENDFETLWFSDGLQHPGFKSFMEALKEQGALSYIRSEDKDLALALIPPASALNAGNHIRIAAPPTIPDNYPVGVQALAEDGRVLDYQNLKLNPRKLPAEIELTIPETLRGEIAQYRLSGSYGAGGVFLLDTSFRSRSVAIVAEEDETENTPLSGAGYYLRRALEPYAQLSFGDVEAALQSGASMMILPDIADMPPGILNNLESWVKDGGLLLRFAGPAMTQAPGDIPLLPVNLRRSGRALQGALTWDKPLQIDAFPENSPFYGMRVPDDVKIRSQILPAEGANLDGKVWAVLEDGTPLITARPEGQGLLVFVHVSADPGWSDLPLSGLFVNILKRLNALSGVPPGQITQNSAVSLDPVFVLDGFGRIQKPDASVKPLDAGADEHTINASHPPGLYSSGGIQSALNIGDENLKLRAATNIPLDVAQSYYGSDYEVDLRPGLLYAAAILLLLDWLIMSLMGLSLFVIASHQRWRSNLEPKRKNSGLLRRFHLLAMTVMIFFSNSAQAQDTKPSDLTYANGLYLAYIKTGDPRLDALSQRGLENLAKELARRTSAEPDGVAGLNPQTDNLAFFSWIYWPVSQTQGNLSEEAIQNVQHYLDHGGTILFDLREGSDRGGAANARLRNLTKGLNIPPLQPMPEGHVLTKAFYLLDKFPGQHTAGQIWLERRSEKGRDGVSSIIIGSNDWASAWAASQNGNGFLGGARQQEMAVRSGVNFAMYALTGNYKADQVHVPYILERLDR